MGKGNKKIKRSKLIEAIEQLDEIQGTLAYYGLTMECFGSPPNPRKEVPQWNIRHHGTGWWILAYYPTTGTIMIDETKITGMEPMQMLDIAIGLINPAWSSP